jgi:hypothetical protein
LVLAPTSSTICLLAPLSPSPSSTCFAAQSAARIFRASVVAVVRQGAAGDEDDQDNDDDDGDGGSGGGGGDNYDDGDDDATNCAVAAAPAPRVPAFSLRCRLSKCRSRKSWFTSE